ncbi:MAG TPA: acetyltransferase [Solirubrobacteraceae bacterium]|nr:acetyltransferase [Solirubrobacteraceae bacterium]
MGENTRLVIATGGGFGRELAAYARDAGFDVVGFLHDLDAYPGSLDGVDLGGELLGPTTAYEPRDGELVAIGVGDVGPRRQLAELLVSRGARLATVVHPTAWVAPNAVIGEGVAIAPFAVVGPQATIGDLSILNIYASVTHDASIGRCCVLSPYATANGRVTLEDEVFLATHATVAPRRRVGARSSVSAGSVVFRDVAPDSLAAGNPARARALYRRDTEEGRA